MAGRSPNSAHGLADLRGPTRVVGGPRSGKTEVLVNLVVEWLTSGNGSDRMVVVVRSWASALALESRIEAELPEAHQGLLIQTHEHLARSVLTALGRGIRRGQVLSRTAEWLAMREALLRSAPSLPRLGPLVDEPSSVNDALAVVSASKRALVGPGLLAQRLRHAPASLGEIAVLAASYQDVLKQMASLDPRDSHGLALEALVSAPTAIPGWLDLLLVDEAEDLSPAEWLLIRELSGRLTSPRRLVMAGHWTESTPGFRGVSSESSSRPFEEYFPAELGARDWVLPGTLPNWATEVALSLGLDPQASGEEAVPTAAEPLRQAAFRVGPVAAIWAAPDETEEALAVAREIVRARLQGEVSFAETAILLRAPIRQLAPIRAALDAFGVPYRIPGGGEGTGNPLVAVTLNWLRVLSAPADPEVLLTALSAGPRAVPPAALRALRRVAGRSGLSQARVFWDWVRGTGSSVDLEKAEGAEANEWELLRSVGRPWLALGPESLARERRLLTWSQVRGILGQVEVAAGLSEQALGDVAGARALADFARCAEATADVERRLGRGSMTLPEWQDHLFLAVRYAGGEIDETSDGGREEVSLMTIRQAKGRSWARVFICGCAAGTLPAAADAGGLLDPEEVQEMVRCVPELEDVLSAGDRQRDAEARLFLVGLTRASSEITCTWARRSQRRSVERSPFLGALMASGVKETPAPRAQLVHQDDLVTELALAAPGPALREGPPRLSRRAAELRLALGSWDPVEGGPARLASPISLSATSIAAWLACPRQYLAYLLGPAGDSNVNLTLGRQAHRLLELLHQNRERWQGQPAVFRQVAEQLVSERLLPEIRAELGDDLEIVYVRLWMDRLVARWGRQIVAIGRDRVGESIAAEVFFDLPREGWRMRGKVDALWRHPNGDVELIDYKTARKALSDGDVRKEVFGVAPDGPRQWQLPVYQIAARAGALAEHLPGEVPVLMRNWYVGVNPGPRDPDPIPASGFRMVEGSDEPGGVGAMTDAELARIESQLDDLAQVILQGRFPAQPRHKERTCRAGRASCAVSFWCDGEGSVGADFPTPGPQL